MGLDIFGLGRYQEDVRRRSKHHSRTRFAPPRAPDPPCLESCRLARLRHLKAARLDFLEAAAPMEYPGIDFYRLVESWDSPTLPPANCSMSDTNLACHLGTRNQFVVHTNTTS